MKFLITHGGTGMIHTLVAYLLFLRSRAFRFSKDLVHSLNTDSQPEHSHAVWWNLVMINRSGWWAVVGVQPVS